MIKILERWKEKTIEEEKRRISKKKATVIIIGILIVVYGVLWGIYHALTTPYSSTDWKTERNATTTIYSNTKKSVPQKSNVKYSLYSADAILDEQLRYNDFESGLRNVFVKSNKELKNEMNKYIGTDKVKSDMQEIISLSEKYNDEFFVNNNLAIVIIPNAMHKVEVKSVTKNIISIIVLVIIALISIFVAYAAMQISTIMAYKPTIYL